jgi:hypothetical protein
MSRLCRLKSYKHIGEDGQWAYDEIIRLREKLKITDSALKQASDVFCRYAAIHAAKTPPDMDKADVNNALYEMCEEALAKIREE